MIDLDSPEKIEKLDKSHVLSSIKSIPGQIEQSWTEVNKLVIPSLCSTAQNVVICGMGGSALGGRILDSLLSNRSRIPIEVFTEFNIPNYVNKDSLVILSSYSGNTQETLSAAYQAMDKKAQIFGITTGGKLGELLIKEKLPSYIFDPKENPSNQPRMALGYSFSALIALLSRCGFIILNKDDIFEILATTRRYIENFDVNIPSERNIAKATARKLMGKIPVIIASEHLIGVVHGFKNQLNENAKTFSVIFDIPELNHHLLEGLANPPQARDILYFLIFDSKIYSEEVKIRYPVTTEVIKKNKVATAFYPVQSKTKLLQVFEVLVFGSYVAFYLAMLYGVDPAPIPWVDYFKERLSKI